ncbi:MAG: NAD(P)-dependent oxidoreductase [Polyangia bacterium]
MTPTKTLAGKTLFITGSSRGIGLAIAERAARDGANIVIAAKSAEPNPKLPGTIHEAAKRIESLGGKAIACVVDVRSEEQVHAAVARAVETFGGIDMLVNNASAINLMDTASLPMKRFDLMHQVNVRGTYLCTQACLPHLAKSSNAHVLNNSPPLNMSAKWFTGHVAYTIAKYGMSMCVLGMADELRGKGIAVNALWPATSIATAATQNLLGGDATVNASRKPEIMADAARAIFLRDSKTCTGNFFIDEEVLRADGVTDFDQYAMQPGAQLIKDFFLD